MYRARLVARAFLAGIMISIGGTVYVNLVETSKIVGAMLFAVGLVTICAFGLALFTGMAGYLFDGDAKKNVLDLLTVWAGNFVGCVTTGFMLRAVLGGSDFIELAETVAAGKLLVGPGRAFVTGMLCGVLMYVAVDNFRNSQHEIGKYLGILLCVPAFILAGFEHSIADMYFLAAGLGTDLFALDPIFLIVCVTAGNLIGSVVFAEIRKFGTRK